MNMYTCLLPIEKLLQKTTSYTATLLISDTVSSPTDFEPVQLPCLCQVLMTGRGKVGCHTSSEEQADEPQKEPEKELVYEGPFHTILRKVKYVSVFSSGATLVSMPILSTLNDTISVQGRVAIGITCCIFAVGTTGLVQWIGKPYVAKIWRVGTAADDIAETIEVQTYSLFAQPKIMQFDVSTVTVPVTGNPFASFASDGNNFYIHSNQELFSQLELYTRLNLKPS